MRKTSIIYIIRRYGLNSKRLSRRHKIKYEDAIEAMKKYENAELRIKDVIDNVLTPSKSISSHCQLPGCGMKIRYEYVLENKSSGEILVAGSTCVWPTLGFSELQKKEFLSFENAIKEHHDFLIWKSNNQEILDKLNRLKEENFTYYRPFWEEVEEARLHPEDEEFIRNTDVDKLIADREERERKRREARENYNKRWGHSSNINNSISDNDPEYAKILKGLDTLVANMPNNHFYKSLKSLSDSGRKLTESQIACIKRGLNKDWYFQNIKGTSKDIMDKADSIIQPILENLGLSGGCKTDFNKGWDKENVEKVNNYTKNLSSESFLAWNLYRVKHGIIC